MILGAALLSLHASGQRMEDYLKLGRLTLDRGDPYGALLYFEKAMNVDSSSGELLYHYGRALMANNDFHKAKYYFYKVYRREQGKIFPDGLFHLARLEQMAGNYREARRYWRRIKNDYNDNVDSYEYKKAIQEMKSCDVARKLLEDTASVSIRQVQGDVNSFDSEFSATILPDTGMSFSALRGNYRENFEVDGAYHVRPFMARKSGRNEWSSAGEIPLPDKLEKMNVGNLRWAPDDQTVYFSVCSTMDTCKIYSAGWQNGTLTDPTPVNMVNAEGASSTQPHFAIRDEQLVLFFSSNRKGGYGGYDIWAADWTGEGFDIPYNLGETINTPDDEVTPFFDSESNALFFSSTWHHGLGGFDIFESSWDGGFWSDPENLKPPYNSRLHDLYFSLNYDSRIGLITSNRGKQEGESDFCCNDIYRFDFRYFTEEDTLPEIRNLADLNKYLPVTLYFHNDVPNPRSRSDTTLLNYVETYEEYSAMQPTYEEEYVAGLSESKADREAQDMADFFLENVDKGVENLELFTKLLARELKNGQDIELTVQGFASPLAATEYNVLLTSRRIASLVNYLHEWNRSEIRPFLTGRSEEGSLRIVEVPYGEYRADQEVSDNPNDKSNAIYSIYAARERKIEIVSVDRAVDDGELADLKIDNPNFDLGLVRPGTYSHEFQIKNTGTDTLTIDSLNFSCDCMSLKPDTVVVYPGELQEVELSINIDELSGKQFQKVDLIRGKARRELSFTFEVEKY